MKTVELSQDDLMDVKNEGLKLLCGLLVSTRLVDPFSLYLTPTPN